MSPEHLMPIKEVIAAMDQLISMLTLLKGDLKKLDGQKKPEPHAH